MDIKQVELANGEYKCDIGISVEEWKEILQNHDFDKYLGVLVKFYTEPHHKSTCKALGKKYNVSPQSFNSSIVHFAKAVQKKLDRFEVTGIDGDSTYWIIAMTGKTVTGGLFEWTLRTELVQAMEELNIPSKQLDEYRRFKKLLEYFVAHLEWVVASNVAGRGYDSYIKPWVESNSFNKSGQGYNEDSIQSQIAGIERYREGDIHINIQATNYKSRGSYLNWDYTGLNVVARWNGNRIVGLGQEKYVNVEGSKRRKDFKVDASIESLGLFDEKDEITEALISFFNHFEKLIVEEKQKQKKAEQMNAIKPYVNLLKANKNLILTGAPGTGKTYLAKEVAKQITGVQTDDELEATEQFAFVQFHPSYDYTDFVEGLRPTAPDVNGNIGFERKDGAFKEFCREAIKGIGAKRADNFDEAWNQLIESIRHKLAEGNLTKIGSWEYGLSTIDSLKYSSVDTPSQYTFTINKQNVYDAYQNKLARPSGAFQKDMLDVVDYMKKYFELEEFKGLVKAAEADKRNFVFVIDEINRGEISKVFGELFFSIDPGYRGVKGKVKTQYSNLQEEGDVFKNGFYVPDNVYILGTMNDIDRSVESFDFAMRRRFAWKEIKADDRKTMWDGQIDEWKEESDKRMNSLNTKIESVAGLGEAFHIGPAYFLKLQNYNGDFDQLWKNHLEGVLFEYLRGMPNALKLLEGLKKAFELSEEVVTHGEDN